MERFWYTHTPWWQIKTQTLKKENSPSLAQNMTTPKNQISGNRTQKRKILQEYEVI